MNDLFDRLQSLHPTYRRCYLQLAAMDRTLARSARTVVEMHGDEVAAVGEPILSWAECRYGGDFLSRYVARVADLAGLQQRFLEAPSAATLGNPTATIARDTYDLTLLLSFVFSNHRFEILQALKTFLASMAAPHGRLASIGIGTGYELAVMLKALHGWSIDGYESDDAARLHASSLLKHFCPDSELPLHKAFPLFCVEPDFLGRFQAIVMCELLEHLVDPFLALETVRRYLAPAGQLFVTMAINIAQEDHVFLYPSVSACREQLRRARLVIEREWLIPVVVHPAMLRQRGELSRGNYAAVVRA